MLSVPFAMVGGVFLQWMLGYPMTTAVIIGYISLFAVAVQTGIIMVDVHPRGARSPDATDQSYMDAVDRGVGGAAAAEADDRGGDVLSLLPIMLSTGAGHGDHEADRRAEHRRHGHARRLHVLFMTPCLFVIGEDIRRWWRGVAARRRDQASRTRSAHAARGSVGSGRLQRRP